LAVIVGTRRKGQHVYVIKQQRHYVKEMKAMVSFGCITCSCIVLGNACPLRTTHVSDIECIQIKAYQLSENICCLFNQSFFLKKITRKILYLPQNVDKFLECTRAAAFFSAKGMTITNKCYIFRNSPYTQINVLLQWSKANPKAVLVLCLASIQHRDLP
jgi:hypothetical protein